MNAGTAKTEQKLRSFERLCHEHGLSVTPQRVAIYRELITSAEHPSAVAIFDAVRKYYAHISLDTVNRTLLTFQKIGLAKVVEGSGEPKRFDPNLEPHHHFRCVRCGRIVDFTNETYDSLEIPLEIAQKFIILGRVVHLEGMCDQCKTTQ
jgi:Fur family peroxide stress response transcriptional regulator